MWERRCGGDPGRLLSPFFLRMHLAGPGHLCCHGIWRSPQQGLGDPISQKRTRGPKDVPSLPEDMLTQPDPCRKSRQ